MENRVYNTIKKYNMLKEGDKVVVGLSGGADSCALLYTLLSLKERLNLEIYACHINHMLRGEESDRDEAHAEKICKENDVKLFTLHADVHLEAVKRKTCTEQCGRDIRYEFFRQTSEKLGAKIATAHTASDNAETVLFNITRGCGARGLCGIPPVRENIIRPLIEVTRSDVEEYCRKKSIDYVTDSTNLGRDYTRNKIRLDAVPVLKEINPSFDRTVSKMTEQLRKNVMLITELAEDSLNLAKTEKGYKTEILSKLSDTVFAECIYILAGEYNIIPESEHIALIRNIVYNSGAVELKGNIFAVSKQGFLRIINSVPKEEIMPVEYKGQESIIINDKKISLLRINIEEFNNCKKNNKFLFDISLDYDTIPLSGFFRTRKSGDKFELPKRKVTKTLKKLFCEMKIPNEQRDEIIIFAHEDEVLWIEGIGASEKFRVSERTKEVLIIDIAE